MSKTNRIEPAERPDHHERLRKPLRVANRDSHERGLVTCDNDFFAARAVARAKWAIDALRCVDHDELMADRALLKLWELQEPDVERWTSFQRMTLLLLLDIAEAEQAVRDAFAAENVPLNSWTDVTLLMQIGLEIRPISSRLHSKRRRLWPHRSGEQAVAGCLPMRRLRQ